MDPLTITIVGIVVTAITTVFATDIRRNLVRPVEKVLQNVSNIKANRNKKIKYQLHNHQLIKNTSLPIEYLNLMFIDHLRYLTNKEKKGQLVKTLLSSRSGLAQILALLYLVRTYKYVFDINLADFKTDNWIEKLLMTVRFRFNKIIGKSIFVRLADEIIEKESDNVIDRSTLFDRLDEDLKANDSCIVIFEPEFIFHDSMKELLSFKQKVSNFFIVTDDSVVIEKISDEYYIPNFDINSFFLLTIRKDYPWACGSKDIHTSSPLEIANYALTQYKNQNSRNLYELSLSGDNEIKILINEYYRVHKSTSIEDKLLQKKLAKYLEKKIASLSKKEKLVFSLLVNISISLPVKDFDYLCEYLELDSIKTKVNLINTGLMNFSNSATLHLMAQELLSMYLINFDLATEILGFNIEEVKIIEAAHVVKFKEIAEASRYNSSHREGVYVKDIIKKIYKIDNDHLNFIREFFLHLKKDKHRKSQKWIYNICILSTYPSFDTQGTPWEEIDNPKHRQAFRNFAILLNHYNSKISTRTLNYYSKLTKIAFNGHKWNSHEVVNSSALKIREDYNLPGSLISFYMYLYFEDLENMPINFSY